MIRSSIRAFFIFDSGYLGPALVSAASLFKVMGGNRLPVTLVFLPDGSPLDENIRHTLLQFESSIKARYPEAPLELAELNTNVFDSYVKRYHFSKAILYKAILPEAFAHCQHILIFDCGMIFGTRLLTFLQGVEHAIQNSSIGLLAAFCVESDGPSGLPPSLAYHPHHALYPGGGTLYFDVQKYAQSDLYQRLIRCYDAHRDQLMYAEQELLCLTLDGTELTQLQESGERLKCLGLQPQALWATTPSFPRISDSWRIS